jgi:hypothetical protein
MNFIDKFMEIWHGMLAKIKPASKQAAQWIGMVYTKLEAAFRYVLKFRKVFLAVPVGVAAVILALRNMIKLPVLVGLDLQASGEFSIQLVKEIAVLGPMAITAICLLLMFCSKRTLTPWLVSVFSLALPILILFMNTFIQ